MVEKSCVALKATPCIPHAILSTHSSVVRENSRYELVSSAYHNVLVANGLISARDIEASNAEDKSERTRPRDARRYRSRSGPGDFLSPSFRSGEPDVGFCRTRIGWSSAKRARPIEKPGEISLGTATTLSLSLSPSRPVPPLPRVHLEGLSSMPIHRTISLFPVLLH